MPKGKTTVDFLNNIDGVEETPKDIFKEDDLSDNTEIEEVDDDKPLPFHKDPKVQRYVEKQIAKALEDLPKPSAEREFRQEFQSEINLPPALVKLVGNDTPEKREALKELAEYMESLPKKAQEQFRAQVEQEQRELVEQDSAALNELNAGFEEIEESYGIDLSSNTAQAQKTRALFVEYIRKVSHKNEDGEVDQFADIPAAWEEFQERNKPQSASRAKGLASRGVTRSADASATPRAGNSWKDVERHFANLAKNN